MAVSAHSTIAPASMDVRGEFLTTMLQAAPWQRDIAMAHLAGLEATPVDARLATATREEIETAIERHLALVTGLLAVLDAADGDPDLEPSLAGFDNSTDDREGGDVLDEGELVNEDGDESDLDSGWAILGGDLGLGDLSDPDRRRLARLGYRL